MSRIAERKLEYIRHYSAALSDEEKSRDGHTVWGRWWVNYARLLENRELDEANAWLETVSLTPEPWTGADGKPTCHSDNFRGVKYLKTLLDFGDSPRLSDRAKAHLRAEFEAWVGAEAHFTGDNLREAIYPVIYTENHDLMALTIGLFREIFAGRPHREHVRQLSQSLAWRFDPGFEEWHSHVYQAVYLMPLLILERHAPDAALRDGARQLANLIFAERALLSVNGHFPGPMIRGYQHQLDNDRNDLLLPVLWMAFGFEGITSLAGFGFDYATSPFEPDPVVLALADDVARLPVMEYRGTRPCGMKGRQTVVYYNTPHVGMGSMQVNFYRYQARYFNVMFAADPSMSLRVDQPDTIKHSPWDERNDKGEVAQYRNWLVSRGTLVECGGLKPERSGGWNLYRVGKGLCAHVELPGAVHVFQTGDLDQYADEREFLGALSLPRLVANSVEGRAADGAALRVRLDKMKMWIDGRPREDWREIMHDHPLMSSRFGAGTVEIKTSKGNLTLSNRGLLANVNAAK